LRWCIRLDQAVLDLDFPVEIGRMNLDVDVNLDTRFVRVAWKDMLLRFLKTERALRRMMDEVRSQFRTPLPAADKRTRNKTPTSPSAILKTAFEPSAANVSKPRSITETKAIATYNGLYDSSAPSSASPNTNTR
jgi:hypothetical protein